MANFEGYTPIDWNNLPEPKAALYEPFNLKETYYHCFDEDVEGQLTIDIDLPKNPEIGLVFKVTSATTGQTSEVSLPSRSILGLAQYLRGYYEYVDALDNRILFAKSVADGITAALKHAGVEDSPRATEAVSVGFDSAMRRIHGE